ncbi:conserved hypothetical protein [Leishmania major strain Friedlin]|uniref:Uncharacterized protein n=1 Tax=Leishmania major TaxID=5664 RepID=Q4QH19_LEIMA|nr:conserved hypothetical protein [Leishmania major strain Friedlin]CAG9570185.1 hypothetical_protein_-_conserved [Leishmania major strain Friedlin]CAJ02681.1 conserved hypothetical protein [Leishmania major strain Friedlin]|eukprot:XP_001681529.1 conserved hypothetical protein [Leishmania major strain Friedlin]
MDNVLSSSDLTATFLPWTVLSSSDGPEVTKNEKPPQQQQAPSQAFRRLPTPVQTRSIPFMPSMSAPFSFSDSAGGEDPQQFSALPLQPRYPLLLSQSFSNQSHRANQYTASSFVHAHDTKASAATDPRLVGAHGGFPMPLNVSSANQAEEENLSCAISYNSNRGEACGDELSRPLRQAHVHGSASFFSASLSSRPSSLLSPSTPAPEEHITGYTSVILLTVLPSFTGEDYYEHAMHGQVEFVKQLCDGTGDNDSNGSGELDELGRSCDTPRSSSLHRLQQSASLHMKAGSFDGLSAARGSATAMGAATSSAPAQPAPPLLSTFQPLSTATTGLEEYPAYLPASTAGAGTVQDAPTGGNQLKGSAHAQLQASSGDCQAPLLPLQRMALLQQLPQQHRAPFTSSPLPAQTWTSTAGAANGEEVATPSSGQQQLQLNAHSQSNSRQYSAGATSGAATLVSPALSGSGVYTTSPAQSFNASNGYHTGSGTPPSGGPAHLIMLLPASSENSSTGHSTRAQQHLYAMQVPTQTLSTSETAAAPRYASPHRSGAVPSPSMQLSSSPTVASGSGASAVPLLYVTAPTAFVGFPPTAAGRQVNALSPSSVSGHSCSISTTQASAPEMSSPSSHYVYLHTHPPANNSPSRPLPLQQYSGNFPSQVPSAGMPKAAEQAASASLHARTSSALGTAAAAHLPHAMSTEAFSPGSKTAGLKGPSIRPVAPATSTDMLRKQVNVHGAMMNVLHFYPYSESAPPALTAQIVTGTRSASSSTPAQSLSGSGWWSRSVNSNVECSLDGSRRSLDGFKSQDGAEASSCALRGDTSSLANAPVLPIFIQMFPCELRDRVGLLNRVIEATCGRDAGLVQSFETRSETSFIAHVRTNNVWELIYKLRCRVLMDRFGFWYAADIEQYVHMKEYCESVRRLPQQTRHFQTDGLPCMPLVVELSRSLDRGLVPENTGPRCFDELVPIAAVDRHRSRLQGSSLVHNGRSNASMSGKAVAASGASAAGGSVFLTSAGDVQSLHGGSPVFLTNNSHVMMLSPHMVPGLAGDSYRTGGSMSGSSAQVIHIDPQFLPPSFTMQRSL